MAYDPKNPKAHYNTHVKVPQSVIDEIQQLGMEAALKKARTGTASPEFVEGVSRFYPNDWRDEDKDQHLVQGPIPERVENPNEGGDSVSEAQPASRREVSGGPQFHDRGRPSSEAVTRRLTEVVGEPNPDNAIESTPVSTPRGPRGGSPGRIHMQNAEPSALGGGIRSFIDSLSPNSDVREEEIPDEHNILKRIQNMLSSSGAGGSPTRGTRGPRSQTLTPREGPGSW